MDNLPNAERRALETIWENRTSNLKKAVKEKRTVVLNKEDKILEGQIQFQ